MSKVMFNGNLLCKASKRGLVEAEAGFETDNEESFKYLEVIFSDEEKVKEGNLILVPKASGKPFMIDGENFIIINIKEVIWSE